MFPITQPKRETEGCKREKQVEIETERGHRTENREDQGGPGGTPGDQRRDPLQKLPGGQRFQCGPDLVQARRRFGYETDQPRGQGRGLSRARRTRAITP